ncbi:hypothetical protein GQ53DRAFT_821898 [Thozetella sp. PMI_491]|nr:hypothetical protein GQ53DRAFT_821898 [Thozetella sp. PMI_491]
MRMKIDSHTNDEENRKITKRDLKEAFLDWKLWLILPPICQGVSPMGLTPFFPHCDPGQVWDFSGSAVNLMTIPLALSAPLRFKWHGLLVTRLFWRCGLLDWVSRLHQLFRPCRIPNLPVIVRTDVPLPALHRPRATTIGLAAATLVQLGLNGVVLWLVHRRKAKKLAAMTPEEIVEENTNDVRYGDKKYTIVYG